MQHPRPAADVVDAVTALLRDPGLVVLTGAPGSGRTTVLDGVAAAAATVHRGGGLAMLTGVPALALSRAVRARLPGHDVPLLAEAVRSRVRGAVLLLDDVQYADPATLAALPLIAAHCRVAVALRTPHRLGAAVEQSLRATATAWLTVPPLTAAAATSLVRRTAAQLGDDTVHQVVSRAGGNPLAVVTLARHAAAGRPAAAGDVDQVAYAFAAALADLPRPARTALAALGLLGRPAPAGLLADGAAPLLAAGLITADPDGHVRAVSGYLAEIAAGLLDPDARAGLHRRLADLSAPAQAARHLAAAGEHAAAYRRALAAADATTGGERAALLQFACERPGVTVDPRVRIAAADAALTAGRPHIAVRVLDTTEPLGVEADVLRGEAHLQSGDPLAARAAVRAVPDAVTDIVAAARDRVLLLAELAIDPHAAADTADKVAARHPRAAPPVAAALAAVHAAHRRPGWESALAAAAADPHETFTARWSGWLLVQHLTADARLREAAAAALRAADACSDDLAYSWQTRFLAAAHWATALHGGTAPDTTGTAPDTTGTAPDTTGTARPAPPAPAPAPAPAPPGPAPFGPGDRLDEAHRRAAGLSDRALPAAARGPAVAAAALIEADAGLLATAQARVTAEDGTSAPRAHPTIDWVAREIAWLDGRPEHALGGPGEAAPPGLLAALHHITTRWAAHDVAAGPRAVPLPDGAPRAARRTLTAWATGTGFAAAADSWRDTMLRERIRCLIAAGLFDADPDRAVPLLLTAEELAAGAGLTVLAGRARRALRRHHIRRDTRGPRSGADLTARERDVLRLVAAGEPTRRIAGQLGISAETVDTHVRAGMRKLGARTRTEAAALAFAGEEPR